MGEPHARAETGHIPISTRPAMIPVTTRQFGDLEVEFCELTVADVRAWLRELDAAAAAPSDIDLVYDLALEGVDVPEMLRTTSLGRANIEQLTPSQLRECDRLMREVNPDFFTFRARLEALGRAALQAESGMPLASSTATSPAPQVEATPAR